jgi:hypothetical protein
VGGAWKRQAREPRGAAVELGRPFPQRRDRLMSRAARRLAAAAAREILKRGGFEHGAITVGGGPRFLKSRLTKAIGGKSLALDLRLSTVSPEFQDVEVA